MHPGSGLLTYRSPVPSLLLTRLGPAVIPLRRPSDEGRPASASARRPRRQARRTSTAWVGLSLSRSSSAHPPYPGVEDGSCAFERSRRADDHAGGELPARYLHAITSAVRARNGDAAGAWPRRRRPDPAVKVWS